MHTFTSPWKWNNNVKYSRGNIMSAWRDMLLLVLPLGLSTGALRYEILGHNAKIIFEQESTPKFPQMHFWSTETIKTIWLTHWAVEIILLGGILVAEHAHELEYSQLFYKDILLSYLYIEMRKPVPSRRMRLSRKAKSSLYKVVPKSL